MPQAVLLVNVRCRARCRLLREPLAKSCPGLAFDFSRAELPSFDKSMQPKQMEDDSFTKHSQVRHWTAALLWFYTGLTDLRWKKLLLRTWWVAVGSHFGVKFAPILLCFGFQVGNVTAK